VPEETAAKKVACPKCQTITAVAAFELPPPAEPPPAALPEPVVPDLSVGPPEALDEYDVPELVAEEPEIIPVIDEVRSVALPVKRSKKHRKKSRSRREGLEKLSLGLGLHVPAPFLFLPAMWTGWIGLVLLMASILPELNEAIAAVTFLEITSGIFLLLATLADIPPILCCWRLPDGPARGLLAAALSCKGLVVLFAVLLFFLESVRPAMLILAMAAAIASWILWMCFLRRVGRFLDRPEFSTEAMQTMVSGLKTLVVTVAFLFMVVGMVMLIVQIKFVFARYALFTTSVSVFLACVRIALAVGQIDSFSGFFLGPTGIPFIMNRHLAMIGSLRMVIERRT
jgi:hypothetical protein